MQFQTMRLCVVLGNLIFNFHKWMFLCQFAYGFGKLGDLFISVWIVAECIFI
jgi:hypothetical protein